VLFPGVLDRLVAQHVECPAYAAARVARLNHLVDVAAFGRDKWVGEAVLILLDALRDLFGIVEL